MQLAAIILALALSSAGSPERSAVPPVDVVQRQAIAYARLDPKEISSWKRRARSAALLPRLQIDYGHREQYDVDVGLDESVYVGSSGVVVGPEEGGYQHAHNGHHEIGVKAIWQLNETIFSPDLLNVSAESRRLAAARRALLDDVTKRYYDRERAAGELALLREELPGAPDPRKVRRKLLLQEVALREATAGLDAMTGGWFSAQLRGVERKGGGGQ